MLKILPWLLVLLLPLVLLLLLLWRLLKLKQSLHDSFGSQMLRQRQQQQQQVQHPCLLQQWTVKQEPSEGWGTCAC
jgi:hypothetical protein